MHSFIAHNDLLINERYFEILKNNNLIGFHRLTNLEGNRHFKRNKFRAIAKIKVEDKTFFLKVHLWPLSEKIKSKIPLLKMEDARNEWENMILLDKLNFNTMIPVAYGEKKMLGFPVRSFTLTENITHAERLETFFPTHFSPPLEKEKMKRKRALIKKVAVLARDFHGKGLNHQDFYLGHLFIRPKDEEIIIIDIQRVHQRKLISMHDRIKDLAQLAFSAQGVGIFSRTDFIRFFHTYLNKNKLEKSDKKVIKKITHKVRRISKHTVKLLERRKRRSQ